MRPWDSLSPEATADGGFRAGRVEVSGGFLLWLALLCGLGQEEALLWCLAASLVHELGHVAAARAMGVSIRRLRLTVVGAELVLRPARLLSYPQELVIALSGPAANFCSALAAARLPGAGAALFVGSSVMLGAFNLLPLAPLDGGQAARALVSLLVSPEAGRQAVRTLTALGTAWLLAAGGWALLRTGYNLSLLGAGFWLLAGAVRQGRRERALPRPSCVVPRRRNRPRKMHPCQADHPRVK